MATEKKQLLQKAVLNLIFNRGGHSKKHLKTEIRRALERELLKILFGSHESHEELKARFEALNEAYEMVMRAYEKRERGEP